MKCGMPQGRGSSFIQMFGKTGIFVIFLTETFICHHLNLTHCVPSSAQATCWGHCLVPAQTQQGEPWEEWLVPSRAPTCGAPRAVWGSPRAVKGLQDKQANWLPSHKIQDMQHFSAAVTLDQLKRILKAR